MNIIAAVDTNWAIGNRGGLLVSIPRDQKMFREMTMGKVIVYGRKTLNTFPQAQPLTGRTNIILSRDTSLEIRGAQVVHSIEELLEVLESYDSQDVYIVGGESVYEQMLPIVTQRILQRLITVTSQMPISPIWIWTLNGILRQTAMN